MRQAVLPRAMSIPEVMGDRCAAGIRAHSAGLAEALSHADRLLNLYPEVASSIELLASALADHAPAVLNQLATSAGVPDEGGSISRSQTPYGDYRRDRTSGCWIWMRSVNASGFPICGRKTPGRQNVAARIYWMLENGPVDEGDLVVRTCGMRLCVNPEHGEIVDRREDAARPAGTNSLLDWAAVRDIRNTLGEVVEDPAATMESFASRYAVTPDTIRSIIRNKVWRDPAYEPGFVAKCEGPGCGQTFKTSSLVAKYHSDECRQQAAASRTGAAADVWTERRLRDAEALVKERLEAEVEWGERVPNPKSSSVWSVASVDQPIGDGGGTLHDLVAGDETCDPAVALELNMQAKALEGLSEELVEAMDESELEELRARLQAEGVC